MQQQLFTKHLLQHRHHYTSKQNSQSRSKTNSTLLSSHGGDKNIRHRLGLSKERTTLTLSQAKRQVAAVKVDGNLDKAQKSASDLKMSGFIPVGTISLEEQLSIDIDEAIVKRQINVNQNKPPLNNLDGFGLRFVCPNLKLCSPVNIHKEW